MTPDKDPLRIPGTERLAFDKLMRSLGDVEDLAADAPTDGFDRVSRPDPLEGLVDDVSGNISPGHIALRGDFEAPAPSDRSDN